LRVVNQLYRSSLSVLSFEKRTGPAILAIPDGRILTANTYYYQDEIVGSMSMPKSKARRKAKRKAKVKKVKRKVKRGARAAKRRFGKGLMGLGKKLSS